MKLPPPFYASGEHIAIDLPGARAVFTTRRGGVSTGPYASLNLGRLTDDRREAVETNRAKLAAELGVEFTRGRQVHGAEVRRVIDGAIDTRATDAGDPPEVDGHATPLRGIAPMVLVADCLPIALAGDGVVAMLHAGWRGLAAGIIDEGIRAVRELGATGALMAAIGPGAGGCCYEVGEEVRAAFAGASDGAGGADGDGGGRRNLDLKAIARHQLQAGGVTTVHDVELCTICGDPSLLFSHRRDGGITGRQAGIVWLT